MRLGASRVLVLVVLVLLFGCGPGKQEELTRGGALDSINKSSKFTPVTAEFALSKEQAQCGVQAGFWTVAGSNDSLDAALFGFRQRYALTGKGRTVFASVNVGYSAREAARARLGSPHRRTAVRVTGIADYEPSLSGYHGKEATFEWRWEPTEIPEEVKQCIPTALTVQNGTALFRLYDDGWRVEEILSRPWH